MGQKSIKVLIIYIFLTLIKYIYEFLHTIFVDYKDISNTEKMVHKSLSELHIPSGNHFY